MDITQELFWGNWLIDTKQIKTKISSIKYEKEGPVPNVIFPCGAVAVGDELFVYYGGADRVVGVCTCNIEELVSDILKEGSL